MFNKNLKSFVLLLYAVLFAGGVAFTSLAHPSKVFAAISEETPTQTLCVPPYSPNSGDASHFHANGWLKIKVVNRATLQIIYSPPSGQACADPSNLPDTYFTQYNGGKQWSDIISAANDGILTDPDISDSIDYRIRQDSNSVDDTRLANFNGGQWPNNGDGYVNLTPDLQNRLSTTELKFAFEEDLVALGPDLCKDADNENVVLTTVDGSNNKPVWWCDSSGNLSSNGSGHKGFVVPYDQYENPENFNITYNVVGTGNSMKIESVGINNQKGGDHVFTWCPTTTTAANPNGGAFKNKNCNGDLTLLAQPSDLDALNDGTGPFFIQQSNGSKYKVEIAGNTSESTTTTQAASGAGSQDCTADSTSSGCGSSGPEIQCSASLLNPLSWVACPIIAAATSAVNVYDDQIQQQLDVESSKYLDENNADVGGSYYQIWSAVRYIAMSLLVIIGLVMVISQAVGSELFDAYTVRKVLPRLLAAVILVSLSWPLAKYMIDISDVLGKGIRTIIYFPFRDSVGALHTSVGSDGLLAVGAAASVALGMAGILLFALSALLAVFAAIVTLVVRKILIIFLVVLAPIAIVAYILPGTQKAWNMWWDNFLKLLLMFPIIMAFIAAGRVFAITAQNTEKGLLGQIIMFIAYFGPYFALPMTFKMGGGLMSMAAGGIHSMSQMGTKRLNARAAQQVPKRMHAAKRGELWHGQSWIPGSERLAHRANTMTKGVGTGWKGHFGVGERGQQAMGTGTQTYSDEYLKEHPELMKTLVAQDDTAAVMGLAEGTSSGAARAASTLAERWYAADENKINRDLAEGRITQDVADDKKRKARSSANTRATRALESARALGINQLSSVAALGVMSQNKSRSIGAGDFDLISRAVNGVAHGNEQLAQDLAYNYQFNSRQAGRQDLGGNWTNDTVRENNEKIEANNRAVQAHTMSEADASNANAQLTKESKRSVFMDAVKRGDTRGLVGGHEYSTQLAKEIITDDFNSGDRDRMMQSAVLLTELQGNLASATGGNRDNIAQTLNELGQSMGIDLTNPAATGAIEQQLVNRINSSTPGGGTVTPEQLRTFSRTWGAGTPVSDDVRIRTDQPPPTNPAGGAPH